MYKIWLSYMHAKSAHLRWPTLYVCIMHTCIRATRSKISERRSMILRAPDSIPCQVLCVHFLVCPYSLKRIRFRLIIHYFDNALLINILAFHLTVLVTWDPQRI